MGHRGGFNPSVMPHSVRGLTLTKQIDVGLIAEQSIPPVPGRLDQHPELHHPRDEVVCGGVRGRGQRLDIGDGKDRPLIQMLQHFVAVAGRAAQALGDAGAVVLAQGENAPRGVGGLKAHPGHTAQEEGEPALPVAGIAHGLQALVVLGAMAL